MKTQDLIHKQSVRENKNIIGQIHFLTFAYF